MAKTDIWGPRSILGHLRIILMKKSPAFLMKLTADFHISGYEAPWLCCFRKLQKCCCDSFHDFFSLLRKKKERFPLFFDRFL